MENVLIHLWTSRNTEDRLGAILSTWGSDVPEKDLRIHMNEGLGRYHVDYMTHWQTTFRHHIYDVFDHKWHLFVEDDVYVRVPKLREYVTSRANRAASAAVYGTILRSEKHRTLQYPSGGAFLMTDLALHTTIEIARNHDFSGDVNDVWIGRCMTHNHDLAMINDPRSFPSRPFQIKTWEEVVALHGLTHTCIQDCWHFDKNGGVNS